jgi:hypothetical protein
LTQIPDLFDFFKVNRILMLVIMLALVNIIA